MPPGRGQRPDTDENCSTRRCGEEHPRPRPHTVRDLAARNRAHGEGKEVRRDRQADLRISERNVPPDQHNERPEKEYGQYCDDGRYCRRDRCPAGRRSSNVGADRLLGFRDVDTLSQTPGRTENIRDVNGLDRVGRRRFAPLGILASNVSVRVSTGYVLSRAPTARGPAQAKREHSGQVDDRWSADARSLAAKDRLGVPSAPKKNKVLAVLDVPPL